MRVLVALLLLAVCATTHATVEDALTKVGIYEEGLQFQKILDVLEPFKDSGNADVEFYLAFANFNLTISGVSKKGIEQIDMSEAIMWAQKAVDDGSTGALNLLSIIYGNGFGVPRDDAKSLEYLERGVAVGDPGAILNMAIALYEDGDTAEEKSRACGYFDDLANRDDPDVITGYYLGVIIFRGDCNQAVNKEAGLELIQLAAKSGVTKAERDMGRIYEYGLTVDADIVEALKWYELAAEHGNASSQWKLGIAYANGKGRDQDSERAVEYFRESAANGSIDGMVSMGVMYATGDGVDRNFAKALEFYKKAADYGEPTAMKNLAVMYANGEGVDVDLIHALVLTQQALTLGDSDAESLRDRLLPRLTASDREIAEHRFIEWSKQRKDGVSH